MTRTNCFLVTQLTAIKGKQRISIADVLTVKTQSEFFSMRTSLELILFGGYSTAKARRFIIDACVKNPLPSHSYQLDTDHAKIRFKAHVVGVTDAAINMRLSGPVKITQKKKR